jgi:hypothetical protein
MNLKQSLAAAVTVMAAVVGIDAAAASPALADCGQKPLNNGEGSAVVNGAYNLKTGMYTACSNTGAKTTKGETVWLQCLEDNEYGNVWWYVRIAGTNNYGWISQDNFSSKDEDDNNDGIDGIVICAYW